MPFKPPLTLAELHEIQQRAPNAEDTRRLLWEIKRMRSELLRWHQVSNDLKRPAGLMGDIYDDLLARQATEPCVLERDDMVAALMEAPAKLRKGMAPR